MSQITKFGLSTKSDWFNLDPGTTFLNHGSYGACPRPIWQKKLELQKIMESNPDKWFRFVSFDLWNQSVKSLANYLNVDSENLVLCENATSAINSILKSIDFDLNNPEGEAILSTQYTYQAVKNSIEYTSKYRLNGNKQIQIIELKLPFPITSAQQIFDELDQTCDHIINVRKLKLKLAVLDHISSMTAMLFPITEMNKIVRKWTGSDCLILIDGAHALGQVKLDFNEFDCDFYVSNLHKWFQAPRGCSFLYFKDKNSANNLQPNYISHGYDKSLTYNFYQRGTSDSTSWFLVDECIDFFNHKLGGIENITEYSERVSKKAVELLVSSWKTGVLEIPKEIEAPFMKAIKLPYLKNYQVDKKENSERVCLRLMKDMLERFNIILAVVYIQNEIYCRISCYVYNSDQDYEALNEAILCLMNE